MTVTQKPGVFVLLKSINDYAPVPLENGRWGRFHVDPDKNNKEMWLFIYTSKESAQLHDRTTHIMSMLTKLVVLDIVMNEEST